MADEAVKKAVGYGFDASLRKGTQAGLAAMRGSNEYQRLDAKGKDAAENMFKSRIDTDSNLKQFKGIGDEKVSVYRNAAKAKPARIIDYKKEFGTDKRPSNPAPSPKQSVSKSSRSAAAKSRPTPKVASKSVGKAAPVPKLKLEAIPGPTQSQKPAAKAPAKAPAKASAKSAPKTTSVGSQRPKASPLKSILNFASPKQGQPPQGFRTTGSGPSSMLVPKFNKKK